MKRLMLCLFILLGGCDKSDSASSRAPADHGQSSATRESQASTTAPINEGDAARLKNAANLRQIGQAIMAYSAAHPTTIPSGATTQP